MSFAWKETGNDMTEGCHLTKDRGRHHWKNVTRQETEDDITEGMSPNKRLGMAWLKECHLTRGREWHKWKNVSWQERMTWLNECHLTKDWEWHNWRSVTWRDQKWYKWMIFTQHETWNDMNEWAPPDMRPGMTWLKEYHLSKDQEWHDWRCVTWQDQ